MDINQMHIVFRQLAQQMGMQNVRAILPAQIDVLLNTAISDIVNQLVRENVGLSNNDGHTDMFKIGQTDALRTLQKQEEFRVQGTLIDDLETSIDVVGNNVLHLIDLYAKYTVDKGDETINVTKPIRIIDVGYLSNTLNDAVLKPTYKSPIAIFVNSRIKLYFGKAIKGLNDNVDVVYSYIAVPKKVHIANPDDTGDVNVDCDLPEQLHETVVKYAVDLYRRSVRGEFYSGTRNQSQQTTE